MPSYKVPRTRPRYYIDESAMNKGPSEYSSPVDSKPEAFAFRTKDQQTQSRRGSHGSEQSATDSDRASSNGAVSP